MNEQYKRLWNAYAKFIIGGFIGCVVLLSCFFAVQAYRNKYRERANHIFGQAYALLKSDSAKSQNKDKFESLQLNSEQLKQFSDLLLQLQKNYPKSHVAQLSYLLSLRLDSQAACSAWLATKDNKSSVRIGHREASQRVSYAYTVCSKKTPEELAITLQAFANDKAFHSIRQDALLQIALLYQHLHQHNTAQASFKRLLDDYPNSSYARQARFSLP